MFKRFNQHTKLFYIKRYSQNSTNESQRIYRSQHFWVLRIWVTEFIRNESQSQFPRQLLYIVLVEDRPYSTTSAEPFCRYFGWSPVFNCPRQWTPRILMAGHGGPLFYTIYLYNVDDEKQLTAMIPRGRPPRILAFGHRDTRGSWPPGSTGVRPRCSTARG